MPSSSSCSKSSSTASTSADRARSALTSATENIQLGTGVCPPIRRRRPAGRPATAHFDAGSAPVQPAQHAPSTSSVSSAPAPLRLAARRVCAMPTCGARHCTHTWVRMGIGQQHAAAAAQETLPAKRCSRGGAAPTTGGTLCHDRPIFLCVASAGDNHHAVASATLSSCTLMTLTAAAHLALLHGAALLLLNLLQRLALADGLGLLGCRRRSEQQGCHAEAPQSCGG